ncbi:Minor protease epr [Paenibacillus polymyxa]|uniref:Bacterial Ig-like domain-containing protein n=1 Tax=Paenibacillus polymyxa (strain SC2) TaxID=886882 RepID=E3EK94_PAEPS|nr:hypothetical protein PPSC2_27955 [Paenibacillus polymyxa SC2]
MNILNKNMKKTLLIALSSSMIMGGAIQIGQSFVNPIVANAASSDVLKGSDGLNYQVYLRDDGSASISRDNGGALKRLSTPLDAGETPDKITSLRFVGNDVEVVFTTSKGNTKTLNFVDVIHMPDVIPDFKYESNPKWGTAVIYLPVFSENRAYKYQVKVGPYGQWIDEDRNIDVKENIEHYIRAVDFDGKIFAERTVGINDLLFMTNMSVTTPAGMYTVEFRSTNGGLSLKNEQNKTIASDFASKSEYTPTHMVGYAWDGNDLLVKVAYKKNTNGITTTDNVRFFNVIKADVAPVKPTIQANTTNPTNKNIQVTITYSADSATKEYKIGENGEWKTYASSFEVSQNTKIYARAKNARGTLSDEAVMNISNIDKTAPQATNIIVDQNKLTLTGGADAEGTSKLMYKLNGQDWVVYTETVVLPNGEYEIQSKAVDASGNESSVASQKVTVFVVDLAQATEAVVKAENAPSQTHVTNAQTLIDALPQVDGKDQLQVRLDKVKDDLAKYEAIQKEINTMNDTLNKGNVKKEVVLQYLKRIDELYDLVKALPNTMDKATLNKQLDDLKNKLILIGKILELNSDGDHQDVDLGGLEDTVNKLPNGDLKDDLQKQLDQAKDLQDAIKKVEKAEQSKSQEDIDRARDAVNKLPDGKVKDELNDRLDKIQKEVDEANKYEKAVKKAEQTKSQTDVNTARDVVNTLPDGAEKDAYHKRLDAVDTALKEATLKVRQAEMYLRDPYLTDAQKQVDALKDSPAKKALQDRLDAVKKAIRDKAYKDLLDKAIQKVEQAELYKRDPYIKNAYDAVNALPDGADKTGLLDRLDKINKGTTNPVDDKDGQYVPGDNIGDVAGTIKDPIAKKAYVDWAKAVERAEKYFSKGNIVFALEKMNEVPTSVRENSKYSALYNEMKQRSEVLKQTFNQMLTDKDLEQANKAATDAVEQYEKFKTGIFKEKAQSAVNKLENGTVKSGLQSRIDAVNKI